MAKKPKPRSRRRRRLTWYLFWTIFFLAISAVALFLIINLPVWQIKNVEVRGTRMLNAREIKNLAEIPYNENLFTASFDVPRRNLKKITAIKSFRLRRFPPGRVMIIINERQPVGVVVMDGRSMVFDVEGHFINHHQHLTVDIPDIIDLPVVSGIKKEWILKNKRLQPQAAKAIDHIARSLSKYVKSRNLQIELRGFDNIDLILEDLLTVKIGDPREIDQKMFVLKTLLNEVKDRWTKVLYIDVRFPDSPVIRYR